jgi:hypothetical protein
LLCSVCGYARHFFKVRHFARTVQGKNVKPKVKVSKRLRAACSLVGGLWSRAQKIFFFPAHFSIPTFLFFLFDHALY